MRQSNVISAAVLASIFAGAVPGIAQNVITTVAGVKPSFQGAGGLAVNAIFGQSTGVAVDSSGNVYGSDLNNCLVYKVAKSGVISIAAGNGVCGYSGDGGAATDAALNGPGL